MKKFNVWMLASSFIMSSMTLVSCNKVEKEASAADRVKVEQFLKQAASTDNFQLMAGMMAEDQSEKGEVGALGQKIYHVHSRTTPALAEIAKKKDVTLPAEMGSAKKALVDSLEAKKGEAFDQSFAEVEVAAHEEAIALYEKADKEVNDPDVQSFIDQILPVLKEHLAEAQELKNAVAQAEKAR
jgi:putative membrane protein